MTNVWLPLDILSHFTVHLLIIATAFFIGFLMPLARVLTAIVIALLGFAVVGTFPQYRSEHERSISSIRQGEKPLRLMTFNTRIANNKINEIADEIRRLDPDIAVLVEFGQNKRVLLDLLKKRFPYQGDCPGGCQLEILSKLPLFVTQTKRREDGPSVIQAEIGGDLSELKVVGVHFTRPPLIHKQFKQMKILTDHLKSLDGRLLLMGDFNATPFSRLLIDLSQQTGLKRLTAIPTWPSHFEMPQLPIDHVFASSDIRLIAEPRIGKPSGSDHYPLALTVAVPVN
jgi:endonuclease/exonuclease/phosphatase (EEP) superfamily protein YafD